MNYDTKNFVKYLFSGLNPKNIFRKPSSWIFLILILLAVTVFFTHFSENIKKAIYGAALILIAIIQVYIVYKSGEHRRWAREKLGMPSKSELKKLKETPTAISVDELDSESKHFTHSEKKE